MKNNRQKSNIMVTVPDISAPMQQAFELFNQQQLKKGEKPASNLSFTDFGYVLTKEGMFVINVEGVGDSAPINPDNRVEIGLYGEFDNGAAGMSMAAFPSCYLSLSDTELIMLPTLKEVPLEEFIRTFGDRLENNYNLWLGALRESEVMTIDSST